ncbi:MAG: hypothetical protein SH850_06340 [Planctomycetaceae bacterium]|nr:hypothetical protein [Planctomycetaceae bacterium]
MMVACWKSLVVASVVAWTAQCASAASFRVEVYDLKGLPITDTVTMTINQGGSLELGGPLLEFKVEDEPVTSFDIRNGSVNFAVDAAQLGDRNKTMILRFTRAAGGTTATVADILAVDSPTDAGPQLIRVVVRLQSEAVPTYCPTVCQPANVCHCRTACRPAKRGACRLVRCK